uniref:Uncharacterized protein n=1 Tax=Tanacetum cinerariifolium TaxID=118510 RepID=A0A6L2L2K4_TANCI|nr:hypothetical protein [Tanacetum cinerariifolium]
MDSEFQSLNAEMQEMRKNYNNCRGDHTSMNDDTLMCERHEENYIESEGYLNQNSQDSYFYQSHHDLVDSEKSLTELNNDVRNDLEDFKRCVRRMRTIHDKLYDRDDERKIDEWSRSENVSLEPTDMTDPLPPPQAHTEHVNSVFTGSGKSDHSLKTQKYPPLSILVKNKIKKDKPIKTSKKGYHVVKQEYPFRAHAAMSMVMYLVQAYGSDLDYVCAIE